MIGTHGMDGRYECGLLSLNAENYQCYMVHADPHGTPRDRV